MDADAIKQVEMKEKHQERVSKENQKTTRDKTIELKPYQRNRYLGCTLRNLFGTFLKWTREELKQMDKRTRKLMTMQKALHHRDDIDRLYVSRKEGRRGLTNIEDSVDVLVQQLEDYF